jgi:hypothetical protein
MKDTKVRMEELAHNWILELKIWLNMPLCLSGTRFVGGFHDLYGSDMAHFGIAHIL